MWPRPQRLRGPQVEQTRAQRAEGGTVTSGCSFLVNSLFIGGVADSVLEIVGVWGGLFDRILN